MLTPWEKELEMLEDWMNNPGPVNDCHEQTIMHNFGEEHSEELLEYFSQGDGQMMMTAMPRLVAEDEVEFQSGEKLEEDGDETTKEMEEVKLSEGEAEQQQLGDETTELESAAEWKVKATRDEEDSMGGLIDLPICRE
jgi:hypothetical protein